MNSAVAIRGYSERAEVYGCGIRQRDGAGVHQQIKVEMFTISALGNGWRQ